MSRRRPGWTRFSVRKRSKSLFGRIFLTRTGVHFTRKCSNGFHDNLSDRAVTLFAKGLPVGHIDLAPRRELQRFPSIALVAAIRHSSASFSLAPLSPAT